MTRYFPLRSEQEENFDKDLVNIVEGGIFFFCSDYVIIGICIMIPSFIDLLPIFYVGQGNTICIFFRYI